MLGSLPARIPPRPPMPPPPAHAPLSAEGQADLAKVRRVNQSWIVRGQLKENAAAWLDHLGQRDPRRLEKSCWLALFLTRYRKDLLRDPKPLFYAGLFAAATRREIGDFLDHHPMTRAICLLLHGDDRGCDDLAYPARELAAGIAAEIRAILTKSAPLPRHPGRRQVPARPDGEGGNSD